MECMPLKVLQKETFPIVKTSSGFSIFIDKKILSSRFKTYMYYPYEGLGIVQTQLLCDITSEPFSSLKVDLVDLKEKDKYGAERFLIKARATTNGNIFQKIRALVPDVDFSVSLEYRQQRPHGNLNDFSEISSCKGRFDTATNMFIMQGSLSGKFPFSYWLESGTVDVEIIATVSPASVFPCIYLEDAKEDSIFPFPGFRKMLESGSLSDVTILARDGEVRCHKAILSGCSSVLQSMFESGMKESQTGQVDMTDMTEEGVWAFLRYLYYTDEKVLKGEVEVVFEVLYAAHKYDVPVLQAEAIVSLRDRKSVEYSIETAFTIYMFVRDILQAFQLRMKMAGIFKSNLAEMEELPDYAELCEKRPLDAQKLRNDLSFPYLESKRRRGNK